MSRVFRFWPLAFLPFLLALLVACAPPGENSSSGKTLYIAGIPDQDVSVLQARFKGMADYLTQRVGIKTQYVPAMNYAAVVTGFKNGDLQLAWFGGLTGVQARLLTPGAEAIAQRPEDESFHSVFIARKGLGVRTLTDLRGKNITFGSESSTSGYTMPLYFIKQAGIDPRKDFASVNYSGSHDKTWKLVESGAFQAGVLNELTWRSRLRENAVDLSKVEEFYVTAPYYDYHWVIRGDIDQGFGQGAKGRIIKALLEIDAAHNDKERSVMQAFQSTRFIPTRNQNYQVLESVARELGIVQ